jgi:hypothetical protein
MVMYKRRNKNVWSRKWYGNEFNEHNALPIYVLDSGVRESGDGWQRRPWLTKRTSPGLTEQLSTQRKI